MGDTESLGSYLKKIRESRKIPLGELARNIRVRENFLEAIEEDRYDNLPAPTYVKGFLVAYAKYVGLDPKEVVARYEQVFKKTPPSSPEKSKKETAAEDRRLRPSLTLTLIAGLLVAGLIAAYFMLTMPTTGSKPPQKQLQTEPVEKPPPHPEAQPIDKPEKKPIDLKLKTIETTWISMKVDGQTERQMLLRPGETISQDASREIRLLIGNAGGLELIHNGNPVEKLGGSGEVVTLIVNPEGIILKRHGKPSP